MRLFLTGGAGYLGTVLARQLLREAHHVCLYDRLTWGPQPLAAITQPDRLLTLVRGDIRDQDRLCVALNGFKPDAVVHLAGIVGYPACDADPDDAETTNVKGTELLCTHTTCPIVFASTGSTYGKVSGIADERCPISPLTRYGRTKAAGEILVEAAGGCILRFATLFGPSPRMRWDLLPNDFTYHAVWDRELRVYEGYVRRTFLHVEDAATAIVWAITNGWTGTYNVGHESLNLTKHALARQVADLTGCRLLEAEGHDRDERDYAVSYEKIFGTGWKPQWTLGAAISQMASLAMVWAPPLTDTIPQLVNFARVWRPA